MLKVLIPTLTMIPTTWFMDKKWLWSLTTSQSLLIAGFGLTWLKCSPDTEWSTTNTYLSTDLLSAPLLMLSCWLLPLMILASQNHMRPEPLTRQQSYITLMILLQLALIMAFGATEIALFYVMFEATLIPTMIIITRWGSQTERLNAGTYFMFYTLMGSLPLLVALLMMHKDLGSLSLLLTQHEMPYPNTSWGDKIWWLGCLMAFLVKMPLYGVHLWLPKAHVEAPVAGSMVLAAVLLKLGGYGIMRMAAILTSLTKMLSYPFMVLSLWGIIMTGANCLRQSDLKALVAYSSVSHMGLVVAGVMTQTPWGFTGSLILMISHGLTSSLLFCLTNTNYERTHSRTLLLTRGMCMIMPLMSAWWLIACLANLALPPLPNLMGELMIITSLFNWTYWSIILTGLGTLITAGYSLYMFLMTQHGTVPPHLIILSPTFTREHLMINMHFIPLLLLVLKPELIWGQHL
uniref:NADH-ubiquinone oxidoreductase chain 4 n=1 Tax=Saccopharynx lavenbergi TaxID=136490 RepID=Q76MG6_9TELE|nr:NADH dehydrogenase subunits 4 [Saccopharynx lavenbergi]